MSQTLNDVLRDAADAGRTVTLLVGPTRFEGVITETTTACVILRETTPAGDLDHHIPILRIDGATITEEQK